jgi:membrane-associated phospholipid phosphatase
MRGAASGLVFLCWAGFAALAWGAHGDGALSWDDPVADAVADLIGVSDERVHANPVVWVVTLGLGLAVAVLAARHLFRRRLRPALAAAVAMAGVVALTELAKLIVSRPVIEGSGDGSFPSGTATWTLAASSVSVLLLDSGRARRLATAVAVFLVVGVAAVVIWERWHYPSDVLGGWFLAGSWVGAAWLSIGRPRPSEPERSGRLLGEHPPDRE